MSTAANRQGFEPLHAAHAIEHVVISFNFQRPLDDATLTKVGDATAAFAELLPAKSEIRSLGFSFGVQGLSAVMPSGSNVPDGLVRQRIAPNAAVEKELRVDRNSISFRNSTYTRWKDVWQEAREMFKSLLAAVPADVGVGAFTLQYLDKFTWNGPIEKCRPDTLLNKGSRFITPTVFVAEDLWHSHFGIFIRVDDNTKRLLAANLDCVDEPGEGGRPSRCVRVASTVTDLLGQPGYVEPQMLATDAMAFLDHSAEAAHNVLKDVISDLLNDEMRRKIGIHT